MNIDVERWEVKPANRIRREDGDMVHIDDFRALEMQLDDCIAQKDKFVQLLAASAEREVRWREGQPSASGRYFVSFLNDREERVVTLALFRFTVKDWFDLDDDGLDTPIATVYAWAPLPEPAEP